MTGKLRELIAWEFQENWTFPILELILAVSIIQVLPIVSFYRTINDVSTPFWSAMVFVFSITAAVIFGRSFAEGIEKRKLIVLLSYPVSRAQVFAAKFLANLLTGLLLFGSVLFVEGVSLFMFAPGHITGVVMPRNLLAPTTWALMFLSLFLVVFFTSSLMTFFALAVKRFGLSVLAFLVYIFGIEYWVTAIGSYKALHAALSIKVGSGAIVKYLDSWYFNTLGIGRMSHGVDWEFFAVAFSYLLVGGLVCLFAGLVILWRADLD